MLKHEAALPFHNIDDAGVQSVLDIKTRIQESIGWSLLNSYCEFPAIVLLCGLLFISLLKRFTGGLKRSRNRGEPYLAPLEPVTFKICFYNRLILYMRFVVYGRNKICTIQSSFMYASIQVFSYLHPLDLHHFSRTTKLLRTMVMSRSASWLWKIVFLRNLSIPPCPAYVSEPQWADILFGQSVCQVCQGSPFTFKLCLTLLWALGLWKIFE
jgi:hypothetical protein